MTTYVCLTENNDWEGETWRSFIPVEGNGLTVSLMAEAITRLRTEGRIVSYRLDFTKRYTEAEVDEHMQRRSGSYTYGWRKLAGNLLPPLNWDLLAEEEGGDLLYKNGITDEWSGLTMVDHCDLAD